MTSLHPRAAGAAGTAAYAAALLLGGLLFLGGQVRAQTTEPEAAPKQPRVEDVRTALEQWQAINELIAKEKADARLREEMLTDRIAVVRAEIDSLRARIDARRKEIATKKDEIDGLEKEKGELDAATASLTERVRPLENRTNDLVSWLPEPLKERIRPLTQRVPTNDEEAANARLTLGNRFQNIVGIVNAVNKFNGEITEHTELRDLEGDKSAEVRAVYVGLGQAYYVSADGKSAGIGLPGKEGWSWTPKSSIKERVTLLVEILANAKPAAYTQLPVEIK